jgi:hypothetical protein
VFPGSKRAKMRLDFFFESHQEKRMPNQLQLDVLSEATWNHGKMSGMCYDRIGWNKDKDKMDLFISALHSQD